MGVAVAVVGVVVVVVVVVAAAKDLADLGQDLFAKGELRPL